MWSAVDILFKLFPIGAHKEEIVDDVSMVHSLPWTAQFGK